MDDVIPDGMSGRPYHVCVCRWCVRCGGGGHTWAAQHVVLPAPAPGPEASLVGWQAQRCAAPLCCAATLPARCRWHACGDTKPTERSVEVLPEGMAALQAGQGRCKATITHNVERLGPCHLTDIDPRLDARLRPQQLCEACQICGDLTDSSRVSSPALGPCSCCGN